MKLKQLAFFAHPFMMNHDLRLMLDLYQLQLMSKAFKTT